MVRRSIDASVPTKREVVAAIMDRSLWQGVMLHHLWAGLSRRD
ncbi:MAG: hypothetical protein ACI9QQ_002463, partial [Myxococcota bacterium]